MRSLSDFDFALPAALIAQHPTAERPQSRLLHVAGEMLTDLSFPDIRHLLRPGDLLVCNDTRVVKARLFGYKPSGGKVEIMVERILSDSKVHAMLRASHPPQPGTSIFITPEIHAKVVERDAGFYQLEFSHNVWEVLERHGVLPLPPYIQRAATAEDEQRYQTVYAKTPGAVAAPTAGLHFTESLLAELQAGGVDLAFITLHVGAGTFLPVKVDHIDEHKMHSEWYSISAQTVEAIAQTRARGGRVVAVGTTSLRALESAALVGDLRPGTAETTIFIRPGFQCRVVDRLVTNFHLPKSTLMMLVCAFGGYSPVMAAYRHAVEKKYRFFSYGDAMLLEKKG